MIEGPAPLALLRLLEKAVAGEPPDEVMFCMGVVLGRLIVQKAKPEHYGEVVEACTNAIWAGINGPMTEH